MKLATRIKRAIVAQIPGTVAYRALEKRSYERQLRAAGYSRTHARAIASERFKNRA